LISTAKEFHMSDEKTPALVLLATALMIMSLAACNTTAGIGRDVESVGDAIEDSAEEAK
jgi:predicted small secreted protein